MSPTAAACLLWCVGVGIQGAKETGVQQTHMVLCTNVLWVRACDIPHGTEDDAKKPSWEMKITAWKCPPTGTRPVSQYKTKIPTIHTTSCNSFAPEKSVMWNDFVSCHIVWSLFPPRVSQNTMLLSCWLGEVSFLPNRIIISNLKDNQEICRPERRIIQFLMNNQLIFFPVVLLPLHTVKAFGVAY